MAPKDIIERLTEWNPDAYLYPDLEEALVGICEQFGRPPVALYDKAKCLGIWVRGGMTEEEAEEWYEYNTLGLGLGENTPAFLVA